MSVVEITEGPNEHAIACLRDLLKLAEAGTIVGVYGCVISTGNVVQPVKAGWWEDPSLALALHDLNYDFGRLRRIALDRAGE